MLKSMYVLATILFAITHAISISDEPKMTLVAGQISSPMAIANEVPGLTWPSIAIPEFSQISQNHTHTSNSDAE